MIDYFRYMVLLLILAVNLASCMPDLKVDDLSHTPACPSMKDQITFTAKVINAGNKLAGPSVLSFKVGGESNPSLFPVPALEPGNTHTVQRQVVLNVAQNYQNTVIADVNNAVAESNENNNKRIDLYSIPFAGCRKVIFHSNRTGATEIFTVGDDGNNLKQLTNSPNNGFDPVYTPDGMKIVFTSQRTGDEEIFIMDENGLNQTNLTNNSGKRDWFPVLSPSGTHIAYWKELYGGTPQLYIMKIDGTDKRALSPGAVWFYPHAFSPSGALLSYAQHFGALATGYQKLYLVNADGTNPRALTSDSADEASAVFSCDSSKVFFSTKRDGNWEIYSTGVDGTGLTNLTNNPAEEIGFDLSPDCSKIVFVSKRTGNEDLFIMNTDGTGLQQLTTNPGNDWVPFFSPDGKKIGFISRPSSTTGKYDLWVINTDGTGLHKVSGTVSDGATCCPKYSFSKDSTKILYHSILPGNNFEIFIVNTDGTGLINLSNSTANDLSESFRPK